VGNPKKTVRESKVPERFCSYLSMVRRIIEYEPSNFEEATNQEVWKDSMVEECNSIMNNDVWEVVMIPEWKSVVTSKWLYKINHVENVSIEKYKVQFVARRFSQVEGVDYDDTFAPISIYTSIQAVISITTYIGWNIHQMDVKTTFLDGIIHEEVYIEKPQ